MDNRLFASLGVVVARHRLWVIAVWAMIAVASVPATLHVLDVLKAPSIDVPERQSGRAAAILDREFGLSPARTAVAVFTSSTSRVADPAYRDAVVAALDRIRQLKGVTSVVSFYDTGDARFVGGDGRTTYAVLAFAGTAEDARDLVPLVRDVLKSGPGDPRAYLTGFPAFSEDLQASSQEEERRLEHLSLPITLALLLLVFGTLTAAGLPVILGAVAVSVTLMLVYLVAQWTDVSILAMNTSTVLGLGLGIDFSLLMVSRFREELDNGLSPERAAARTVVTAGQSIVYSGMTVIVGISVLLLYDLIDIRSMAVAMMLVTTVAVLSAVTLLPAVLVLVGRRINAWAIFGRRASGGRALPGRWHAWSMAVMRHPWPFLLGSLAILLLLAWPAREMRLFGNGGYRGISAATESRQGYEALVRAFPPGESTPISVVLVTSRPNGAWDAATKEAVFRLTENLKTDPRVARVDSLATVVPGMTLDQVKALGPAALVANPSLKPALGQFVNLDRRGDVVVLNVIARTEESALASSELVTDIRTKYLPTLRLPPGTETYVTGETALLLDYRDEILDRMPLVVGVVLLITYVILLLFFNSLILPLKAILMNLASVAASYGVMTVVFQYGGLDPWIGFDHLGYVTCVSPIILFAVLFGLSTDYEVFLLSRVKELVYRGRSNEVSVAEGLERTAGLITAAGLVMLGVFGTFALADILIMKEIGLGVAVAILLDATLIRIVIVPAAMKLMGSLNWWMPSCLRFVPTLTGEPALDSAIPYRPVLNATLVCWACQRASRPGSRYCGYCGAPLTERAAAVARPRPAVPAHRPSALASPKAAVAPRSTRLIPVTLMVGGLQGRAWVQLEDCLLELDPEAQDLPTIAIRGMKVKPLAAGEQPHIQLTHAHVVV